MDFFLLSVLRVMSLLGDSMARIAITRSRSTGTSTVRIIQTASRSRPEVVVDRSVTSCASVTLKFLRRRLLLGLAGSLLLGRLLAGLIVGDATDLLVLAGGALLLLAIRAVACYVAARRAASVDPMIALREDQGTRIRAFQV